MNKIQLEREWKLHQLGISEDSIIESIFKNLEEYLSNPLPYALYHCHDKDEPFEGRHILYHCKQCAPFVMEYSPVNDFLYIDYKYIQRNIFKKTEYSDDTIKDILLWWTKEIQQMSYDLLFVRPNDSVIGDPRHSAKRTHSIWWTKPLFSKYTKMVTTKFVNS